MRGLYFMQQSTPCDLIPGWYYDLMSAAYDRADRAAGDRKRPLMTSTSTASDLDRHYYWMMALCLGGLLAVAISVFLLPGADFDFYTGESGPVQVFSAAAYLTAVVALSRETSRGFMLRHFYFMLIPVAMCLRELDFHNRFSTMSTTKLSFYISPEVPFWEKVLAVAVFAALIWAGGIILHRHATGFLDGLRRRRAYAIAIVISALLAVGSKTIDGIARKLAPLGIDVSSKIEEVSIVAEEVMELGIPVFLVVAIFAFFPRGERVVMRSPSR